MFRSTLCISQSATDAYHRDDIIKSDDSLKLQAGPLTMQFKRHGPASVVVFGICNCLSSHSVERLRMTLRKEGKESWLFVLYLRRSRPTSRTCLSVMLDVRRTHRRPCVGQGSGAFGLFNVEMAWYQTLSSRPTAA